MFKLIFFCFVLVFCSTFLLTQSIDVTHNLPSLSHIYPDCSLQLSTKSAATCFRNFYDVIKNYNGFDPTIGVHCCADWDSLACVKGITENEPQCRKSQEMIQFISDAIKKKEKDNIKSVCDPFAFNCPSAPKFGLEDKYPQCYAKVKNSLESCKPNPMNFKEVSTNPIQCCQYWAMITCERDVILNEPTCTSAKDFANAEFKKKKDKALSEVCNPYKYACKDAPDLEAKYPLCFAKLAEKKKACEPADHDFRDAAKNKRECCAYWEMVECTRRQAVVEPVCKESRGFIEVEFSPANQRLKKQYCDPKRVTCEKIPEPTTKPDPNQAWKDQYPECFKKIAEKQKLCTSRRNSDYSNAQYNKEHCCGFWAMIGCTRASALMEPACGPVKSYINAEYNTKNSRLIAQYCSPYKFRCTSSGGGSKVNGNKIVVATILVALGVMIQQIFM